MSEAGPVALGITIGFLGLAFIALAYFLLRLLPRSQAVNNPPPFPSQPLPPSSPTEAILLIQAGGRVAYLNQTAREWFGMLEEAPNIEYMARRTRPSEAFLGLCAEEGKARFSLNGRFVDGSSFYLPYGTSNAIFVSLTRPQVTHLAPEEGSAPLPPDQAIDTFAELSQAMAANLDLESALLSILESVERLISSDFAEITISEPENQKLIPYRLVGEPGLDRHIEKSVDHYKSNEGYSGYLASQRTPLLIGDVDAYRAVRPAVTRNQYPFNSYLGVPLLVAGELVGTLELASLTKEGFTQNDLEALRILSGQAAVALKNALLYQEQQRRILELTGLAEMARAVSALGEARDLYTRLVESIGPLISVEIIGFWIYDLEQQTLEAQLPFIGIPPQFTDLFHVSLPSTSETEQLLQARELMVTSNAEEDQRIAALGLSSWAMIAGVKDTVLVPLTRGGQLFGYLQVADKRDGSPFDENDLRLLTIIGGQASIIIENATLVQQTQGRAQRAEALRKIASLTGSAATLDEILKFSLLELARLLHANVGLIYLANENLRKLNLHQESLFGVPDELINRLSRVSIDLPPMPGASAGNGRGLEAFVTGDTSQDIKLSRGHRSLVDTLKVTSLIGVLLVARERVIGEVLLGSYAEDCFDNSDLIFLDSAAGQLAGAIERSTLYNQTDENLVRRVEALTRLHQATRALQFSQPLETVLESMAWNIREATPFNAIQISTYDPGARNLVRRAAVGIDQAQAGIPATQSWTDLEELLKPEYRMDGCYLVPPDRLLLPLVNEAQHPLGLIELNEPLNALPPDPLTLETLSLFASQVLLALESFCQLDDLKSQASAVQQELVRSEQASEATQSRLPALLHKDLEQTLAIQRLSERTRLVQEFWDITEVLNQQSDRSSALQTLAKEILARLHLDIALVAEPAARGPRLSQAVGALPPGINPEALLGQRNPLRQCLQRAETKRDRKPEDGFLNIFVSNLEESREWRNSPLLEALGAKAFICLTIPSGNGYGNDLAPQPPPARPGIEAVLMAVSFTPLEAFSEQDVQLFTLLTRQVSVALQNLHLLTETNRRLEEVDLLLEFSRQLGSLDTSRVLHTLVETSLRVIPAAHAGMVALWDPEEGCLVPQAAAGYHHNQRILEIIYHPGEALPGQAFEKGQALRLDVDFARDYALPAENLLRYRDATAGKLPVSTLVVPIGGTMQPASGAETTEAFRHVSPLGVLVLDNFDTPSAFTSDDQAVITSLAQQTALTLENVRLYQASEQRAVQLQTLTDVAATITSSLQTDDLIASLLDQVKVILPYDTGTLWIHQGDRLTVRAANGFTDSDQRLGLSVSIEDSLSLNEMVTTGKAISVADVSNDPRFPSLVEHQYLSWLAVPLLSKGEVIGVIALEKTEPNFYTSEHIQAITTFAGQAAVSLVNANLYEESVRRAAELDQRSKRLALLNRLSAELSSTLEPAHILKLTSQELHLAVHCSAVSALLFDPSGQIILQAESPITTPDLPFSLPEAPIFDRLRESLGVFNAEDINDAAGQLTSPDLLPLSGYLSSRLTRALLILPLATGNDLHGLLFIHNDQPYRYTADEVELARTISNQASVAIQNANLFAETQWLFAETRQSSAELATLFDLGVNISQVLDQQELVRLAFDYILHLLEVESVALVIREENGDLTAQAFENNQEIGPMTIPASEQSFSGYVLSTGEPLLIGDVERDKETLPVPGFVVGQPARAWLGVPLIVRGETMGVLAAQSDEPDHFGEAHLRLLRQIGNHLAVALDNARLFATVQTYAEELEQRVADRTAQLAREHRRTQTLLGIISELSTSLDMDIVLNRTLALINETTGAEHSLIMLILPGESTLYLRASLGYRGMTPKGGHPSALKANEGLAGWVITNRKPTLITDLLNDPRWIQQENVSPQHRSAIAVPLEMGEETLGALLLYHQQVSRFSPDQLDLVQATAKQIAVAINNAQLYSLIRDQAERLGDMLRRQHVETSQSQAILEAVADGVLVTDGKRIITLFNASAEHILGLSAKDVVGQSLEHFIGLFGKAAHTWMDTIRIWSEDPSTVTHQDFGYAHTEQLELDDKRVVSVHLSPVHLRNDFLGTVSIFRDITHQVVVDRLKSEFVATVSHELRTPMTSIKGYVEILLMGAAGSLSDKQYHFLEIVRANTERLTVLVNDLLDISRIEAGRVTLSMQPLDMNTLVNEAVAELTRRTQEDRKPMDIHLELPASTPRAIGDLERVRQIMDNLLENAYYYTPEGGQIIISLSQTDDEVKFDVKDTGIGILPSEQPRIFERFYRGEDPLVLATSGTGLGLSIVQRLVDMHKGRIWLESSGIPGEGSTFSFTLPIYTPGKDEA